LYSLFSGKIGACLTRQKFNKDLNIIEKKDLGRDWYDFVWYIDKGIKPNYDFLYDKLKYKGNMGMHLTDIKDFSILYVWNIQ